MVRGPRVLLVDDDPAMQTWLRRVLTAAGYQVQGGNGQAAIRQVAECRFDLMIFDIDSPRGRNTARIARELSPAPIVVLSSDEDVAVDALDKGADDYVRKPFSTRELMARIKNALRRKARQDDKPARLVIGDVEIDLLFRRIFSRGREVHLPVRAYEVLRVLAEGAGKVLTHEEILRAVWGESHIARRHDLRVAVQELRRKLEPNPTHPRHILTEIGVGYRLDVPRRAARMTKERN